MSPQNKIDSFLTKLICVTAIMFLVIVKSLPAYYFWHGQKLLEKQEYVKAYNSLKKAYRFNPNKENYRYYYVKSLINLSPTVKIQKQIFEIANGTKKDSAQQLAEDKILQWEAGIKTNIGDNYIEQVPANGSIIRWDINKFPLKIAIKTESGISIPDYYQTEIHKAFGQWQVSSGFIKFAITEDIKNADILVKISELPQNICDGDTCRYIVGYTTPNFKGKTLKNMTIVLYDKAPNGNFFSDKELYNTILHEIGHALGIMGHSYSAEDLMYMSTNSNNFYTPYRSSFQYLSSQDINTIKLLYKLVPDITNTPINKLDKKGLIYAPIVIGTSEEVSSRKVAEAKNYIKNAPELAGGYIDLGIAYAELNRNKEAVKSLEKAYELSKTDNERYTVLYNLAALYFNNKNFDKAIIYAEKAKNIYDNEDIKNLIMQINHAKATKSRK